LKTTLDHLPKEKQDLINSLTKVIVEKTSPEKVISYGSYATGKWVEDEYMEDGRQYDYKSDYDFLVITKSGERLSDAEVQEIVERRSGLNDHISAISHDIEYVNGKLSDGQYFFSDIQQEGILLYDAGNVPLAEKRDLDPLEKKAMAQEDFDNWYNSAKIFLKVAKFCYDENEFKNALFELHQSAERLYNTVILVFRGYKPKTHNLEKLRRYAKHFSSELAQVFPLQTKEDKDLFTLLRKGCIEARYDKKFSITKEDVATLIERMEKMQEVTRKICSEKIASLGI
jgi:HEPN domain-containing protein/predicted nucleotidyltransferase